MPRKPTSDLLWPLRCPTCLTTAIIGLEDVKDPENFQFVLRCQSCGFLNVIERTLAPLPVLRTIKFLSPGRQNEAKNILRGSVGCSELRALVTTIVRELDERVDRDIDAAQAAFALMLRDREDALRKILESHTRPSNPNQNYHSKIKTRVSDLLYLLLSRRGPVKFTQDWKDARQRGGAFLRRFFRIASDAAVISLYASAIDGEQWKLVRRGDNLFAESTALYSRSLEWELNRREFEAFVGRQKRFIDIDPSLTAETLEAQRLVFGFDSTNIIELVQKDFETMRKSGAARMIGGTFALIEVDRLDQYQRKVLCMLVLTLSRVVQYISPFYLDLGISRRQIPGPISAIAHAVSANWTNYYPLYEVVNSGGNCWIASTNAILLFLTNLITFKNGLFQRAVDLRGQTLDSSSRKALVRLGKSRQHRLEDAVMETIKKAAWNTLGRIKKWNRVNLPFGDIDVLAAKPMSSEAFVILAEVKDFDLPLFAKRGVLERMRGQIDYAGDQLQKRIAWVQTAWNNGLKEAMLGNASLDRVFLLPLVITERYLPPFIFIRFLGIPFGGLQIFLNEIVNGGFSKYKDLSRGTFVLLSGEKDVL